MAAKGNLHVKNGLKPNIWSVFSNILSVTDKRYLMNSKYVLNRLCKTYANAFYPKDNSEMKT